MPPLQKISIVGNSGAGKSFFGRKLSRLWDIPIFTVDKAYWLAGWQLRDEASFNQIHDGWLKHRSWIIDGVGYWHAMERRLLLSDQIFHLDFPMDFCLKRAEKRIEEELKTLNPDIADGCRYGDVRERQMDTIVVFHETYRPKLKGFLKTLDPEKVVTISSSEKLYEIGMMGSENE